MTELHVKLFRAKMYDKFFNELKFMICFYLSAIDKAIFISTHSIVKSFLYKVWKNDDENICI